MVGRSPRRWFLQYASLQAPLQVAQTARGSYFLQRKRLTARRPPPADMVATKRDDGIHNQGFSFAKLFSSW